uniref:G protein subunit gamma 7 n=1 Tax=Sus scrofa TaxID=9823 RepID=A0A4X1VTI0_PIG
MHPCHPGSPCCVAFVWHVPPDSHAAAPALSWAPRPSQKWVFSPGVWSLCLPAVFSFVLSTRHRRGQLEAVVIFGSSVFCFALFFSTFCISKAIFQTEMQPGEAYAVSRAAWCFRV